MARSSHRLSIKELEVVSHIHYADITHCEQIITHRHISWNKEVYGKLQ